MLLSEAHIAELTGRKRPHSQFQVLRRMGLEAKPDAKGHPKVAIGNFEKVFGCLSPDERAASTEPNFGALHASQKKK